ncbi:MAG: response regulator [Thermomicrobiales bacterium]
MQPSLRTGVIQRAMHILLVEDEVHVRIALARPLLGWGHQVSEAASLAQASDLLATTQPELAIIDINLPDGTGWDVLQLVPVIGHQTFRRSSSPRSPPAPPGSASTDPSESL